MYKSHYFQNLISTIRSYNMYICDISLTSTTFNFKIALPWLYRIPQVIWTYHSCSMFRTLRRRSETVTWIDPKPTNQIVGLVVVYKGYLLNLLDYRNFDSPKYIYIYMKKTSYQTIRRMEFLHVFFVSWLMFVSDHVVCLSQDVCWIKEGSEAENVWI